MVVFAWYTEHFQSLNSLVNILSFHFPHLSLTVSSHFTCFTYLVWSQKELSLCLLLHTSRSLPFSILKKSLSVFSFIFFPFLITLFIKTWLKDDLYHMQMRWMLSMSLPVFMSFLSLNRLLTYILWFQYTLNWMYSSMNWSIF